MSDSNNVGDQSSLPIHNMESALVIALYARVSTSDQQQNPETQLAKLREFCQSQGLAVYGEYIDRSPANDLVHWVRWRDLLDDAARKKFSSVLVFKLDRVFCSVKHNHDTLAAWGIVGVSFMSLTEQFDTSTALGRLLLNLLASLPVFELELIRQSVKPGMDRARRQGIKIGRPKVTDRREFERRFGDILGRLNDQKISRRQALRELGTEYAPSKRLIYSGYQPDGPR